MASDGFWGRLFAGETAGAAPKKAAPKKAAPKKAAPRTVNIPSPLSGRVIPLAEVDDRAFAEKMMGDGVAILPDGGTVFSPFAGVVETVAETGHAVGLRSDDGIELLIHVGIETVKLKGAFFTVRVREGSPVKAGDPLIDFDAEAIRAAGYDTATPVTVINADAFDVASDCASGTVASGDPLLSAREKLI